MSTYTDHLNLANPADDDNSWGDETRQNRVAMDNLAAPDYSFFVSPGYATGDLYNGSATDRRHFDTIQGAINAVEDVASSGINYYTIYVYPGAYPENLTITKSMAIVGVTAGVHYKAFGGRGAYITGGTSGSDPTIEISPAAASTYVSLMNFGVSNVTTQAASGEWAGGMALDINEYASGSRGAVYVDGCWFRPQTRAASQLWTSGISVNGYMSLVMQNSVIKCSGYAGGSWDEGIMWAVYLYGGGASRGAEAIFHNCKFANDMRDSGYTLGTDYGICKIDNTANVSSLYCTNEYSVTDEAFLDGGTGTNNFWGWDDQTDLEGNYNKDETDQTMM